MKSPEVILIRESWADSLISDFTSFALALVLIGIGVWLQSSAMQWLGFVLFAICLCTRATGKMNSARVTAQEAADKLKRDYNVVAKDNP